MLAKRIINERQVYSICEKSIEIKVGDMFKTVVFSDQFDNEHFVPLQKGIICCGNIREEEMLFCSDDGVCYFSIIDGWGVEDGILYGLNKGMFFKFPHPTTFETIVSDCEEQIKNLNKLPARCGQFAAMARAEQKKCLGEIESIMKKNSYDKITEK